MGYQLGVDIGTTHTAAAVLRSGRAEMATLDDDSAVIRSVVFLETDGTVVVGETASQQGFTDPTRVARSFKRRVGDATPMVLGGTSYSGGEVTAKMLRRVVDIVSEREGTAPELVTVTHPAHWGALQADLVTQVIERAGLDGARTISDPEAAAIHHSTMEERAEGDVVVVYDLGGGTFDVAVARKTRDGIEIVGASGGIDRLGGIDFDEAVLDHIAGVVGISQDDLDSDDPSTAAVLDQLRQECAVVKEALSTATEVSVPVFLPEGQREIRLTRDDLEAMIRPALTETIEVLRRTLHDARVESADVDAVVLVGGSSRIPLVARMVSEELGRPVTVGTRPKDTVALGAALSMLPWAEEHAGDPAEAEAEPDGDAETDVGVDENADADPPDATVAATKAVVKAEPVTSTGAAQPDSSTSTATGTAMDTETRKGRSPRGAAAGEATPTPPPTPPMSRLTSIAAVLASLGMIAAAVGAGTLIADGKVGIGIALVVAAVAACVALVLMLRRPSAGSSS